MAAGKAVDALKGLFRKEEPFVGPTPLHHPVSGLPARVLADKARLDPIPLRDRGGGYYAAERHPDVLYRQYQLLESFAPSGSAGGSLPRWIPVAIGLLLAVVLAFVGWEVAPAILGGGAVKGSGGLTQVVMPYVGLGVGALCGVGLGFLMMAIFGRAPTGDMWPKVYARARISQVKYVDAESRDCDENDVGAVRVVVRRMRTWLMRMVFADRQEGIFVPTEDWKPGLDLFREGDIRIETTADLSAISHPSELYSGRPLSGVWRGVNSVRWWVQLREPIEAGKETAIYDGGEEENRNRRLIGNAGFWMLAAGILVGLVIFFNALDSSQEGERSAPVDRTPTEAPLTPGATPATPGATDGNSALRPVSRETGLLWFEGARLPAARQFE